ncbi:MAG: c-type cytochrome [Prolixibacteraceae bacterium]|jgi:cytochrome c oxidase cbb3-type subunit 3|nr:c-type cytochrome [Prolixibacteraceae bacterium]
MEESKKKIHEEIDPLTNDKFVPDHEFDGIRELNNNPPSWLNILFVITLIFGYAYLVNYHWFKAGDLQEEAYAKEIAKYTIIEEEDVEQVAENALPIVYPLTDETRLADGAKIFANNCAVCHLAEGQGLVGPNLTDDYWIHGGSYDEVKTLIMNGVIAKGMIAWKTQLSKKKIDNVASYIFTLRGTNPPNPKAPEGELYKAE